MNKSNEITWWPYNPHPSIKVQINRGLMILIFMDKRQALCRHIGQLISQFKSASETVHLVEISYM
jgi:hypothetical protein